MWCPPTKAVLGDPDPDAEPLEVPLGSVSLDGTTLRWEIPALGGLQREVATARVTHWVSSTPSQPTDFDNRAYPA